MKNQRLRQIGKFCAGGVVGVSAFYISMYVLTEFLGVWYIISATIAWVLNWGCNFLMQKFWTFGNKDSKAVPKQLTAYFGMAIGFWLGGTVALYLLVEYGHLHYLVAQIIIMVITSMISYVVTSRIFKT